MPTTAPLAVGPDASGHFGVYGGRYVPETLVAPLEELAAEFARAQKDPAFLHELQEMRRDFTERLTQHCGGAKIYLKREDLLHTGAHKINNALGQVILARRMGKKRIIAETGAGQHGVATATMAARYGMECIIYMGEEDMRRQALNVTRMRLLGAKVVGVTAGQKTLKEAVNEAMRDWVTHVRTTHYVLGTAYGAHPYPYMVREFHKVIGEESRSQLMQREERLPDVICACVGGGSNAIGIFYAFLNDPEVRLVGVELGVLQGSKSFLLQNADGQIESTHSVSAGLDYAAVGPEHCHLRDIGRAEYTYATDDEALDAFSTLGKIEGILPALETAHGVAFAMKEAPRLKKDQIILVNLSGRGDKDVNEAAKYLLKD